MHLWLKKLVCPRILNVRFFYIYTTEEVVCDDVQKITSMPMRKEIKLMKEY